MFKLNTASRVLRKVAGRYGIASGYWEPVNAGQTLEVLAGNAIVARVWNTKREAFIRAWELRAEAQSK